MTEIFANGTIYSYSFERLDHITVQNFEAYYEDENGDSQIENRIAVVAWGLDKTNSLPGEAAVYQGRYLDFFDLDEVAEAIELGMKYSRKFNVPFKNEI